MFISITVFTILISQIANAAECQLTHSLKGEGPQVAFDLNIPGGYGKMRSCKRLSKPNVKICWEQDDTFRAFTLEQLNQDDEQILSASSFYEVQTLPPKVVQLELHNGLADELFVVSCK
ncbi:MAG: hypothetical protein ABIR96_05070 [Bdellovibrionota bacterium]